MVLQLLSSIVDQDIELSKSSQMSFNDFLSIGFLLQISLNEVKCSEAICLLFNVSFCILSIFFFSW